MQLVIFQATKHLIVGAFATLVDLFLFEFLFFLFPVSSLMIKGVSFLFSTIIKYGGNKYWAFLQHEREDWHKEVMVFFVITLVGLAIDLIAFHYCAKVVDRRLAVVLAAAAAAAVNFTGYKFVVFKK